jgi:hypothetical protein
MPPHYPDINTIIQGKLKNKKSIPLSVTKMLNFEILGTMYLNTYSTLEKLFA